MKNKLSFKFNIQLFSTITANVVSEAIKDCKTPEEIKSKLESLGVVKVQEKEVIKEHTKESVQAFMTQNKEFSDGLYNSNIKHFLSTKFGKKAEEITEEDIKAEIVNKKELVDQEDKFKKLIIDQKIEHALGDKALLLGPHIKKEGLKLNEKSEIVGLNEEIQRLKGLFPDQFINPDTEGIPGGGTGKKGGKTLNGLEELRKKAEETGNIEDRMEYSRALKAEQSGGEQ